MSKYSSHKVSYFQTELHQQIYIFFGYKVENDYFVYNNRV